MYEVFVVPLLVAMRKKRKRPDTLEVCRMITSRHRSDLRSAWYALGLGEPTLGTVAKVLKSSVGVAYPRRAYTLSLRRVRARTGTLWVVCDDIEVSNPEARIVELLGEILADRALREQPFHAAYLAAEQAWEILELTPRGDGQLLTQNQFRQLLSELRGRMFGQLRLVKQPDLSWRVLRS